jgi:glucan-binding YG repeat protein
MKRLGKTLAAAAIAVLLLVGSTISAFAAMQEPEYVAAREPEQVFEVEGYISAAGESNPDNPAPSTDANILSFVLERMDGKIIGTDITVELPYGTNITSLTPLIDYTGESISPRVGQAQNFSSPVDYTVTAQNGAKKTYTVTVTVAIGSPAVANDINSFSLAGTAGAINGTIITVEVPYATNLTSLIPIIGHTGKSIYPLATQAQDFTKQVLYTVTAENGDMKSYTVIVTTASPALSGWVKQADGKWKYYVQGVYVTGWQYIARIWYHFSETGIMHTSWLYDSKYSAWFYLAPGGAMQIGWLEYGGNRYYLTGNGAMKTGWKYENENWYYLGVNGVMKTSWVKDKGTWYYLYDTGIMAEGSWVEYKGAWYFLRQYSGTMPENKWLRYEGNLYYLKADGRRAYSETLMLAGRYRTFGSSGILLYSSRMR